MPAFSDPHTTLALLPWVPQKKAHLDPLKHSLPLTSSLVKMSELGWPPCSRVQRWHSRHLSPAQSLLLAASPVHPHLLCFPDCIMHLRSMGHTRGGGPRRCSLCPHSTCVSSSMMSSPWTEETLCAVNTQCARLFQCMSRGLRLKGVIAPV